MTGPSGADEPDLSAAKTRDADGGSSDTKKRKAGDGADVPTVAAADLAAGHPWLAADRLESQLARTPDRHDVRMLLGEILLTMGESVRAGRALAQTELADHATVAAVDAWLATLGNPERLSQRASRSIAKLDLIGERFEALGPVARARLAPYVDGSNKAEAYRATLARGGTDETVRSPDSGDARDERFTRSDVGAVAAGVVMVIGLFQVGAWIGFW